MCCVSLHLFRFVTKLKGCEDSQIITPGKKYALCTPLGKEEIDHSNIYQGLLCSEPSSLDPVLLLIFDRGIQIAASPS